MEFLIEHLWYRVRGIRSCLITEVIIIRIKLFSEDRGYFLQTATFTLQACLFASTCASAILASGFLLSNSCLNIKFESLLSSIWRNIMELVDFPSFLTNPRNSTSSHGMQDHRFRGKSIISLLICCITDCTHEPDKVKYSPENRRQLRLYLWCHRVW